MLTDAELRAIRERCEAATPGPWKAVKHTDLESDTYRLIESQDEQEAIIWFYDHFDSSGNRGVCIQENNLPFILNARTDVPALLAEIERLRHELRLTAEALAAANHAAAAALRHASKVASNDC